MQRISIVDSDGHKRTTSLLSLTEDMACYSFSIPAGHTCPSAIYGDGTICDGCYAVLNRYGMDAVADAQWTRLIWTKYLLQNNPQLWIDVMVANIIRKTTKGKHAVPYFRWHDSGDVFHITYLRAIIEVCKATPMVSHWLPTRGWQVNRKPIDTDSKWHAALLELSELDNVVVRSSALDFNAAAPTTPYGPGSAAYKIGVDVVDGMVTLDGEEHHACPKSTTDGGTCAACNCRRCWESDGGPVGYFVHGWQGRHKPGSLSDAGRAKRDARRNKFQSLTISAVA